MALDLNQSWSEASSKISSIKTTKELKSNEKSLKKKNSNSSKELKNDKNKKRINDIKNSTSDAKKQIKSETKNQLELLLDLFKESAPNLGGPTLPLLSGIFLQAVNETKEELGNILVNEVVSTIGCSEEQSYDGGPFYIKVSQVDLFKTLLVSPTDDSGKFFYESEQTTNGTFPYSMNLQLYQRLQQVNQPFSLDTNGGNGQQYIGLSLSELFDFEYVQNYTDPSGTLITGDFFKVTLQPQLNNRSTVSDFLRDYYGSIDILSFDLLAANLKNYLTGAFSFSIGTSSEDAKEESKFMLVLKRLMGVCKEPQKIDVAGTAKLSDLDNIDESFFDATLQEDALSDMIANNIVNGVVEFEDCDNVLLPVNIKAERKNQEDIVGEKNEIKKVELFKNFLDDMSNDPSWQKNKLEIKASFDTTIITKLPLIIFKTLLSPKVMFGFLIMIKAVQNEFGKKLDDLFYDLIGFMKSFSKFVLGLIGKIMAIFVEKLFKIVKKNIKGLVESILTEIINESKIKKLRMYSTIVYILLIVGQAVIDFRNCKSVIDEILKLLNLALSSVNLGLPPFILASANFLGGVSDTRSVTNVIENLQKAGLPTGAAPDGGPNLMNIAISSIIQGQNKEQAENGKTEIFIPPLTVTPAGLTLPTKGYGKSY
jgi:hypothetical protein